ncbi:hypothetical protein BDZ97DRAFT_1859084 [Flammula alnicola]|nr:hypothetical protein BDZ97DRAFT_1859084 [Flammula alnicola]
MLEDKRAESEMNWKSEWAAMEKERRAWAREQEEHARRADEERQEEEKREREERDEEARQRDGMSWAGLEPNHCLRYGVKEYTATLTHVPLGFNAIEECHKKSIEIHGRQWLPSLCEDQGICGRVTAHWQVDANEAMCTPWWGAFQDKGCVESGIRRHEARLESIQDTTNWEALCSTTPANINGMHYGGPTSCTGWGLFGVWGIWLVDDNSCR